MDYDDYESLPTNNFSTHMTAGAIAGVLEHCIMYPLDSVKTRMQSLYHHSPGQSISGIFLRMVQQEGILRPMRGLSAVVMGAGPAHAFYFASYEYMKKTLSQLTNQRYNHIVYGASGCVATLIHDAISNPTEVVKQRLQMYNSPYRSVLHCIRKVQAEEGFRAFYRSYTTQLVMNVPFQSIHFISYEFIQNRTNRERQYNPLAHMVSGGVAGAVAAAATTPLDVCKTLLNTEGATLKGAHKSRGIFGAIKHVYKLAGPLGYFRGMQARVLYQMPAAAICWSTYEFFKYILTNDIQKSLSLKSEDATSLTDKLNLSRLVLPPPTVNADREEDTEDLSSCRGFDNNDIPQSAPSSRGFDANETLGLKTRELPAVSGANIYGALSFNTMHSESKNANSRIGSNNILDIRHS